MLMSIVVFFSLFAVGNGIYCKYGSDNADTINLFCGKAVDKCETHVSAYYDSWGSPGLDDVLYQCGSSDTLPCETEYERYGKRWKVCC